MSFGAVCCQASSIPESFFLAAAEAVANSLGHWLATWGGACEMAVCWASSETSENSNGKVSDAKKHLPQQVVLEPGCMERAMDGSQLLEFREWQCPKADLRCQLPVVVAPGEEELLLDMVVPKRDRIQEVLHPGKFQLKCDQKGNYDRLEPGFIEVPATFEPLQFTILAKMKKRCTFQVVDHLNRPYPLFPMRSAVRATGQVKSRLGVGHHVVSYNSEEDSSQWPVEPVSQELEVRGCVMSRPRDGTAISGITSEGGVATVELPVGTDPG
eukprot:Skav213955  [mRNA]  locus=scaffold1979:200042:213079:- [translate_table: standard]